MGAPDFQSASNLCTFSAELFSLLTMAALILGGAPRQSQASSHREAPHIISDPLADGTDLYAWVPNDRPDSVTLIANYVPLQVPSNGPN